MQGADVNYCTAVVVSDDVDPGQELILGVGEAALMA